MPTEEKIQTILEDKRTIVVLRDSKHDEIAEVGAMYVRAIVAYPEPELESFVPWFAIYEEFEGKVSLMRRLNAAHVAEIEYDTR